MQPAQTHVRLEIVEIEPDRQPISGLFDRDGAIEAFSGWIELVSPLQAATTTPALQAEQPRALAVPPKPEGAIR
jgi:hypothetical protein